MDPRFPRQLHDHLPHWVQNGWISPEQAALLAAQYPPLTIRDGREWWQVLLSILAVLCVGAGIIALFAANWDALSRLVRAGLSVTPLILGQAAYLFAFFKRPHSALWRESSALFIAIACGAAIALIAQTYHIESSNMFLRLWIWLILPLVYLARSWASAFFTVFLIHAFGFTEIDILGTHYWQSGWEYLGYILALFPWLFIHRQQGKSYAAQSALWRSYVSAIMLGLVFMAAAHADSALIIWCILGSTYLAVSSLQAQGQNLMQRSGALALASMMLLISEQSPSSPLDEFRLLSPQALLILAALLFALSRIRQLRAWDIAFVSSGLLLLLADASFAIDENYWPWLLTFVIAVLGLWQLHRGLYQGHFIAINASLIWILFALYLRFVESDISLWLKGIIFIAAGLILFALNWIAARRKQGDRL